MKRLKQSWDEFVRVILIPVGAGEVQTEECRRAFYAGAYSIFTDIMDNLSPGTDSEPADEQMLTDFQNELKEYADDMARRAGL